MAIITAGVTASWGGTVFGTVVELRSTMGGSLPINRGAASTSLSSTVSVGGGTATQSTTYTQLNTGYGVDVGTIEVLCLHTANIEFQEWGKKRTIAMGGAARSQVNTNQTVTVLFTAPAICQTLQAGAKTNDVWRFQGTFKLCKETN